MNALCDDVPQSQVAIGSDAGGGAMPAPNELQLQRVHFRKRQTGPEPPAPAACSCPQHTCLRLRSTRAMRRHDDSAQRLRMHAWWCADMWRRLRLEQMRASRDQSKGERHTRTRPERSLQLQLHLHRPRLTAPARAAHGTAERGSMRQAQACVTETVVTNETAGTSTTRVKLTCTRS